MSRDSVCDAPVVEDLIRDVVTVGYNLGLAEGRREADAASEDVDDEAEQETLLDTLLGVWKTNKRFGGELIAQLEDIVVNLQIENVSLRDALEASNRSSRRKTPSQRFNEWWGQPDILDPTRSYGRNIRRLAKVAKQARIVDRSGGWRLQEILYVAFKAGCRKSEQEYWMPIETAPKYDVPIIIWVPSSHRAYCVTWRVGINNSGWGVVGGGMRNDLLRCATHWMPMPEPPTTVVIPYSP